jgi:hypothetical protein
MVQVKKIIKFTKLKKVSPRMPVDYKKYPPNWPEIKAAVRERSRGFCEFCGLKNHSTAYSLSIPGGYRQWYATLEVALQEAHNQGWMVDDATLQDRRIVKPVKVILTTAHLDHDPWNWNVKIPRLRDLCQICHLKYDGKLRKAKKLSEDPTLPFVEEVYKEAKSKFGNTLQQLS